MGMAQWKAKNLLWKPPSQGSYRERVRDLLRAIAAFTVHPSEATLWRGHSSHHYRITPSIARGDGWQDPACSQDELVGRALRLLTEASLASRFWRDGLAFRGLSALEQLEHLQHHGGGTPLVDLTPDPMVALWMASEESRTEKAPNPRDGLLIGFNVDARWTDVSHNRKDLDDLFAELEGAEQVGWAIPPVINDRIVVQRSRFLVSRLEPQGRWHEGISDVWIPDLPPAWTAGTQADRATRLAKIFDPTPGRPAMLPILAFAIPGALKLTVRKVLANHYGISRETIYPDAFDGVRRHDGL